MILMSLHSSFWTPPPPSLKLKEVMEEETWYGGFQNQPKAVSLTFFFSPASSKIRNLVGAFAADCLRQAGVARKITSMRFWPHALQRLLLRAVGAGLILCAFTTYWLVSNKCEAPVIQGCIWCTPCILWLQASLRWLWCKVETESIFWCP